MPTNQSCLWWANAAIAVLALLGVAADAEDRPLVQPAAPTLQLQGTLDERLLRVRGGIYVFAGSESNSVIQVGEDGVLVVDTLLAAEADPLLRSIRQLSSKPIRYVVNTDGHRSQIGGNVVIAAAGQTITGGNVVANIGASASAGAAVIAHESVLERMTGSGLASAGWPTETFSRMGRDLYFNGEGIRIRPRLHAHSRANSTVYFRGSDVIVAGDLFSMTGYPEIDVRDGGTFAGTLSAINDLIDVAIPRLNQEGGTLIVPGQGRVSDEADIVEYRDMLTIIRDRIQSSVAQGKTLEQILAARPTLDYDGRWGVDRENWNTRMFVETIYRELVTRRGSRLQPDAKIKGNH